MSACSERLIKMVQAQEKLKEKEQKLRQKRALEIGLLAEKSGLLTAPDACLAGLFQTAQQALHTQAPCLQEWVALGTRFLTTNRPPRLRESASTDPMQTT